MKTRRERGEGRGMLKVSKTNCFLLFEKRHAKEGLSQQNSNGTHIVHKKNEMKKKKYLKKT